MSRRDNLGNAGVHGLVDIPGVSGVKFEATVFGFNENLTLTEIPRPGRGDTDLWAPARVASAGGSLAVVGQVRGDGHPLPDSFKGQTGTISITYTKLEDGTERKQTLSVVVVGAQITLLNDKPEDFWKITLACRITAEPDLSGFVTTQPVGAGQAQSDKELFEELSRLHDPDGLDSNGTRLIEAWPIGNADAAETSEITAIISAAVALFTNAKVRNVAMLPGRWFDAARFRITFDLTTSAEDIVNAETVLNTDPGKISTQGTAAAINDSTPTLPTVSGQTIVLRATSTQELNDNNTKYVAEYGQRDTVDDIEMPGTWTDLDPLAIDTKAQITDVYDTATPPIGDPDSPANELQLTSRRVSEINRDRSERVLGYETLNSEEKRTYPKIRDYDDANNVADESVRAEFWTTGGSAPALPTDTPTLNVKLIGFTDVPITPLRNMRVWVYGARDSRDDLVLPNHETTTDASDLDTTAIRAYLDGESVPSTPTGTILRDTKVKPITVSLGVNRTLTILIFGKLTRKQEIELLRSKSVAEPGNVAKREIVVKVLTTATPVTDDTYNPDTTNLAFSTSEIHQVTGAGTVQYVHVMTFEPLAPIDEAQESFKQIVDDPSTLLLADDRRRIIDANATTAAPSVTAVNGQAMVCNRRLTQKRGRTLYQHDFWYAFRSVGAQLEADRTTTETDPDDLASTAVTADVWLVSGGAPAAPTLSGFKLRRTEVLETANPLYRLDVYRWALTTEAEDLVNRETFTAADPESLESRQQKAAVNSTPSLDAGYKVRRTTTRELNDDNDLIVVEGALTDTTDDVEYPGTVAIDSLIDPTRFVETTVVASTDTVDDIAEDVRVAAQGDPTFDGVRVVRLTPAKVRQQVETIGTYLMLDAQTQGRFRTVGGIISGGVVKVRASEIVQRGTGLWSAYIVPQTFMERTAEIELERRVDGTSLDWKLTEAGSTNNAGLLSLTTGLVQFVGRRYREDLARTGRIALQVDRLRYSNLGHYTEGSIQLGWVSTNADLSAYSPGDLIAASVFGWADAVVASQIDLSFTVTP